MSSETKSWTDDLPVCNFTGAGFSTNQLYKDDGLRLETLRKFNDRSFHCQVDDNTSIYAIFSGHGGSPAVAEFCLQRIAAEILLGQLNDEGATEEDVKEVLRQAFVSAEKGYLDSIDSNLARKTVLQCELEGLSQYEISRDYQAILDRLNLINAELNIGTSIVLALIHKSKLYICNIGTCRALLCKNDVNNVLRVVQLSVDHNLYNEDEVHRLCQLGVDVQVIRQSAPGFSTRCIGSYSYKSGYKDCELLSSALSEPVIARPEIVGPIPLDYTCRFLLLMSGGLCRTLSDVFSNDTNLVNKEIVQMAVEQFRIQSTLMGVSQSIVHKVDQMHHDTFMRQIKDNQTSSIKSRDDIVLLVRNFNFPMPNSIQKKSVQQVSFDPVVRQHSSAIFYSDSDRSSILDTNNSSNSNYTDTNSSISSDRREHMRTFDKNYKVKSYVEFADYYKYVEHARIHGKLPADIDFD